MKYKLLIYSGSVPNPNFYYYTKLPLTHAFLLLNGRKKIIITNSLNRGLEKKFDGKFIIAQSIFDEAKKLAGRNFSIDGSMPFRVYKKISKGAKLCDVADQLYQRRMRKKSDEIAKIKTAASRTIGIIEKFSQCEGKTEEQVVHELVAETYKEGLEPAFQPIVATGRNAGTPHAFSTKKRIADFVLMDYGVKYKNYCADITRCYFFNSKKAERLREKYEKLRNLTHMVIDAAGSMRKSSEVSAFYEKMNKKFGFPQPLHSIGHGIGLEVHEYPRFGKRYNDGIVGATFTIEPGIYESDYGLRCEETVYHNGKKAIVL